MLFVLHNLKKKHELKFLALLTLLVFTIIDIKAQFPLTQRKRWNGPFQIIMTSSAGLQPVYLDSLEAIAGGTSKGFLLADSVIRDATIQRTGTLQDMNNRYKNGSSNSVFELHSIPKSSFLCPGDPDSAGCLLGLLTQTPNSICPNIRYNGPDYSKLYVSMTYPDYDNDMTTFSSSMGQLSIPSCSEIAAAYLYWTGTFSLSNPPITLVNGPLNNYDPAQGGVSNSEVFTVTNTPNAGGFDVVKFKVPGGAYQSVTASTKYDDGTRYVCIADVTSLVSGVSGGQFWIGNLRSYPIEGNGGSSSGWTLLVVYKSPLSPPTLISLWDGLVDVSGSPVTFNISGFTAPSSGTFNSYIGVAALDAEDVVSELVSGSKTPVSLGFDGGAGNVSVNPFTDQPSVKVYNKKGYPAKCDFSDDIDGCKMPLYDASWCSAYDGALSSEITSYNETNGKNGNQIMRLPSNKNTLGYDAHHIKLPVGAVAYGATSATLTVPPTNNGSMNLFMSYIAVEQLQPKLILSKIADKNSSSLNSQITYTLRVKNVGNVASLGGDKLYDTLDAATDYVPNSFSSIKYIGGVAFNSGTGVTLTSSSDDNIEIGLSDPIEVGDSVDISFAVNVISYTSNPTLFDAPSCKRTVKNTAFVNYNTAGSGVLQSKSNANDCGIGSETSVVLVDSQFVTATATVLGPYNGCNIASDSVRPRIKSELIASGVMPSEVNNYDIRDQNYVRVKTEDLFGVITNKVSYFAIWDHNSSGNCEEVYQLDFACGCTNSSPLAVNDTIGVCLQNSKDTSIFVTKNDSDPDGDGLLVTSIFNINGGNANILSDSTTIKFIPNPGASGVLSLSYEVCDNKGSCSLCDTATIFLCANVGQIFIPNFITPGSDHHNDFFEIVGLLPNSTLKIYNRWGEVVYSSNNYNNDWHPSDRGDGLYFYYFIDPIRKKEWKGWLEVIHSD